MSLYKLGISDKTTAAAQNSDPEVQQMLENAQQNNQIQTPPNDGILDSIKELFGFGSAQSAEMPKVPNLTYRNINLPFNLNTGVTNTTQAAPFLKSMADIDASGNVNTNLVNKLIAENQKKASQFNPRNIQSIFPTNFPSNIRQDVPLDVSNMSAIDETTNDEQNQEYIDLVEKSNNPLKGIMDFIKQFSPMQMFGRGIGALNDKLKQSSMYIPSTTGVFGYTPAQLNQMNALGGFYSAPERERRRRANRISNMLNRAAKGKNYSKKNLSNLMDQFGMGDVDTGRMIDSIKKSSNMGYGRGDVGRAATPDRDYSSSPGAMAGDMEYGEE
jgi:hypothetical protein|tara:strand:- start:51 stop:1037 length:987 start_codon:yes stop_codon:yes gene_type:complete